MDYSSFTEMFSTQEECLMYVQRKKYGQQCKNCRKKWKKIKNRKGYYCRCSQVFPLVNTIFENTQVSLLKWFFALFLFSNSKNGVAAKELQRQLGIGYKSAWRMGHKIRDLMKQDTKKIDGIVETDETYIGRKSTSKKFRPPKKMIPVIGMVERGGKVKAFHIVEVSAWQLLGSIERHVKKGARIITDEFQGYYRLSERGYEHSTINHQHSYVEGDIYTNTIEGFWSQMKKTFRGTYYWVSKKHLQAYVDERCFFYNYQNPLEELLRRI